MINKDKPKQATDTNLFQVVGAVSLMLVGVGLAVITATSKAMGRER